MSEYTNEQLCEKLRKGDPDAVGQLLERNERFIRGMAGAIYRKYALSPADRDDLTQEGRLGLWKAARMFDPAQGTKFLAYGGKAAQNAMRDWLNGNGRRSDREFPYDDDENTLELSARDDPYTMSPEEIYLQKEKWEEIREGMRKLSPRGRAYLLYRFGFDDGEEHCFNETARRFHLKTS